MKAWNRLTVLVPALLLLLLVGLNGLLLWLRDETIPDEALVEINRMAKELEKGKQMNELASSKIQVELLELKKTSMQSYMDRSRTRSVLLRYADCTGSAGHPVELSQYEGYECAAAYDTKCTGTGDRRETGFKRKRALSGRAVQGIYKFY